MDTKAILNAMALYSIPLHLYFLKVLKLVEFLLLQLKEMELNNLIALKIFKFRSHSCNKSSTWACDVTLHVQRLLSSPNSIAMMHDVQYMVRVYRSYRISKN